MSRYSFSFLLLGREQSAARSYAYSASNSTRPDPIDFAHARSVIIQIPAWFLGLKLAADALYDQHSCCHPSLLRPQKSVLFTQNRRLPNSTLARSKDRAYEVSFRRLSRFEAKSLAATNQHGSWPHTPTVPSSSILNRSFCCKKQHTN